MRDCAFCAGPPLARPGFATGPARAPRSPVRGPVMALPRPGTDRVLIKVSKAPGATSGGLLLSAAAAPKVHYGKVVALGHGKRMRNGEYEPQTDVAVGDTVMFDELANWKVQWDDEDYVVCRYRNICGKW
mmetsp:Transcript_55912/g.137358  ORF Transcript_55912/g.137358 Transcript_55912/m.137358 type:complete len:130 (+) Transcript_55912:2441-2830(+)